jgi:uncharacterized sodium:solute symporter family permease YidK
MTLAMAILAAASAFCALISVSMTAFNLKMYTEIFKQKAQEKRNA